jgi:hypothetical protein
VVEDGVAVAGVADGRGREAQHVLGSPVLRDEDGVGHERGQRLDPARGDLAALEVLGQSQRLLVGVRRERSRAAMCVDDEQVPSVGADVKDAEAHGSNLPAGLPLRGAS